MDTRAAWRESLHIVAEGLTLESVVSRAGLRAGGDTGRQRSYVLTSCAGTNVP